MKNLTVVIGSCDSYNNMWKNFDILFKRYWNLDTENIFVGETIPIPYDGYINVLPGTNLPWGQRILEGLKLVKTDYVCLLLEDYYLTENINGEFIKQHIDILEERKADKVMFATLSSPGNYNLIQLESDLFQFRTQSMYLNSVQPAIWKINYIKDVLKPDYSPWDFELKGNFYTSTLNPKILLKARENSVYFNYSRAGGQLSEGWQEVFQKENLT